MTIKLNIHEPHQIIRTTNQVGTVIHSWVVNEDGTLENCEAGIRTERRDVLTEVDPT